MYVSMVVVVVECQANLDCSPRYTRHASRASVALTHDWTRLWRCTLVEPTCTFEGSDVTGLGINECLVLSGLRSQALRFVLGKG